MSAESGSLARRASLPARARDRDGVVLRACRRVFDLRRIAELDRYGVAQHVAERPLSIARAIQKTVVLTDKHTDEIAVRGLGKVEDARNLRTCELSRRRRDRLLATEQTVQNVAARAPAAGCPDLLRERLIVEARDYRELTEWRWH